jgi:DNA polymerase III subunit delta'
MTAAGVVGHLVLRDLLARAVVQGTVPHSLLFDGPDGIGKRAVALELAAAINCTQGRDGRGCGTCRSCRRIARLGHPDVVLVRPNEKGSISVDMVRGIIAGASYRPFEARRRVVVIDEADALQPAAQNALLKTLEEPPPTSIFVLATSRPDLLLVTVRSRCHRLRFGPLSPADVASVLQTSHGLDAAAAAARAAVADGSVARALAQETGELEQARRAAMSVLGQLVKATTPAARLACAQQLVDAGDGARKKSAANERHQLTRRLDALAVILRDVAGVSVRAERDTLANADVERDLARLSQAFSAERAVRGFVSVEQARRALERNVQAKAVADWVAFEL